MEEIPAPKGKYSKTNGCSQPPSKVQVLGLVLIFIVVVLHANIISLIAQINDAILVVFMGFYFIVLIFIAYDYFQLVLSDPVDPRLLGLQLQKDKDALKWCKTCKTMVHTYSYHCKRCDRCVEEFDHHCKFVNNCIGKQNYSVFYRIVLSLILFLLLAFAQGLWVVLASSSEKKWIGLTLAILSVAIMIPLVYLAAFHCYISFWGWGTTLRWIMENHRKGVHEESEQKTEPAPAPDLQLKLPPISTEQLNTEQSNKYTDMPLKREYLY